VAFGGEYRHENYKIFAGELGSYNDADGVGVGGNAGSQGFPGFQPADEVNANRHSTAAYLDLEADLTDTVKAQAPCATRIQRLRLDHHRQAGRQLARRADRAAARFGFDRLPRTVAAAVYFSSTFTDFIGGVPTDVVLAPNNSAVANRPASQAEGRKVDQLHAGLDTDANPPCRSPPTCTRSRSRTASCCRAALTTATTRRWPPLATLGVGQAQFFVNSVDTKTKGLDLTASHKTSFGADKLATFLALNVSKTEVTGIHAPASLRATKTCCCRRRSACTSSRARRARKATLGFDYTHSAWKAT
jgi:iron complex outermembrane receptor protein